MEEVKNISLAKEIISKRFDENDKNYGMYYLSCYALLSKFGDQHLELIENLFLNCEFFVDKKPLKYLVGLTGYHHKIVPGEIACSFSGVCAGVDNQLNFKLYEDVPKVCMSTETTTPNEALVAFTHEVSHILKALMNNIIKIPEKNTVVIRRGACLEYYDTEDRDLKVVYQNTILDEVINVFQTSDMMESICKLDKELLANGAKEFFKKLDLEKLSIPAGYNSVTTVFGRLWENESFRSSTDNNIVVGNIKKIEDDFDNVVGEGKFMKLSKCLDNLFLDRRKKLEDSIVARKLIYDYNKKTNKKCIQKVKS